MIAFIGAGGGCGDDSSKKDGGGTLPDLASTALPDLANAPPDLTMTGGPDGTMVGDLKPEPDLSMTVGPRLKRASRSSAIAISDDDRIVAAVSPDDDRVYLIDTANGNAKVTVQLDAGADPRSIAFSPDGSFWVANRAGGTLQRIGDITSKTPTVGKAIAVGAEPTGVAVSPYGSTVLVAMFAEHAVARLDVASGKIGRVNLGTRTPRAITVTNAAKTDADETAYVTMMFAEPVGTMAEGSDTAWSAVVLPIEVGTGKIGNAIRLAAIADTGFKVKNPATMAGVTVGAFPNQLAAIALHNGKAYVPSTAASPAPPVNFAGNVHPFVSVFDTGTSKEVAFGASGTNANTACGTSVAANTPGFAAGTLDLAVQTRDLNGTTMPPPVRFPTTPVDIDFVPGSADVGYVVSQASDEVMRVVWDYTTNTACAGAGNAKVINLQSKAGDIRVPIGIVIRNDGTRGYVNSWTGRAVEEIDFGSQSVKTSIPLSAQPVAGSEADSVLRGKKFFFTGTGRWSNNGWGSCAACHTDGLADNVTWIFPAGPRQTIGLDSDYGKNMAGKADPTDLKLLNWTAINDEIHDFENNTRGVSGGLGAVVSVTGKRIDVANSATGTKDSGLSGSLKAVAADGTTPRPTLDSTGMPSAPEKVDLAIASDWDAVDAYVRTIRSTRRLSMFDPSSPLVQNGRKLFQSGNCAQCHAGPKWTISRRPYTPTQGAAPGSTTCSLQTTPLAKKSVPVNGNKPQSFAVNQQETEQVMPNKSCVVDADCAAAGIVCTGPTGMKHCSIAGSNRITCSLRNVGTFGAGAQGTAFEVRADTSAAGKPLPAAGAAGYNVPSLLSLPVTAPYLHNGAAVNLIALLTDKAFNEHLIAGNPNFTLDNAQANQLAAFLFSIDQETPTFPIDPKFDLCEGSFKANNSACTNP